MSVVHHGLASSSEIKEEEEKEEEEKEEEEEEKEEDLSAETKRGLLGVILWFNLHRPTVARLRQVAVRRFQKPQIDRGVVVEDAAQKDAWRRAAAARAVSTQATAEAVAAVPRPLAAGARVRQVAGSLRKSTRPRSEHGLPVRMLILTCGLG